jgi:hypothetical protein
VKISKSMYDEFTLAYHYGTDGVNTHQRLGQAFCCYFHLWKSEEGKKIESELWELDNIVAEKYIAEKLIDWNN